MGDSRAGEDGEQFLVSWGKFERDRQVLLDEEAVVWFGCCWS